MKRPLDTYAAKRKFTRTSEPGPKLVTARQGPLMFIVQKHAARRMHYDFRLEVDGVLKSWAVPKGPSLQLGDKRLAVEVEDHPFDYASFEGEIPEKEYGAGHVIVWDCGVYSPDEDEEYLFADRELAQQRLREGLAKGKLSVLLRGDKLKGSFALVRTTTDKQWLLIKHEDRFASNDSVLAKSHSVLCGLTLDQMAAGALPDERLDAKRLVPTGPAEKLPEEIPPMLAETSGQQLRTQAGWLYEPKLDGYRVIAFIEHANVYLQSRRGIDLTPLFPEIVKDLAAQAVESMVLDGEIVVLGPDGRPSFNALQNRAQTKTPQELLGAQRTAPAVLVCFDLLHFAGIDVRSASYVERRRYLTQCLLPSSHLQLMHVASDAEKLYAVAFESGFEGVMGKRMDSPYHPGRRSPAWLKFKAVNTSEFVIGGYTKGKNGREPLGALILGYWKNNELHCVGKAGSGFDEAAIESLLERFKGLERKTPPFLEKPPFPRAAWLNPQLVAEVEFDSWSSGGQLRHPVFLRLRDDVPSPSVRGGPEEEGHRPKARPKTTPADEIGAVLQQLDVSATQLQLGVAGHQIKLTSLDKVYWPAVGRGAGITKRDLIRYLAAVSPYMLPHLCDRPLTMIRMPEGIEGERFFQKHWEQTLPSFVDTVTVYSEHKADQHAYIVANNLPTLLWLAQVGTLEFHIWHSRAKVAPDSVSKSSDYASSRDALEASVLNYPDYLVFDIDPYIYSGKEPKGAEPELNKRGFSGGRRVAFWLRALLKEMSLDALVKTSGKTGLHVFVPIERTVTFDGAREICEMVGRHVMRQHPKEITMDWAVIKRTGKIFIDYNMNVRGKTLNVAYSPRGVPGAPISMPLTWEELEAAEPLDFTMSNVLARLEKAGDRWHDAFLNKYSLARAFGQQR